MFKRVSWKVKLERFQLEWNNLPGSCCSGRLLLCLAKGLVAWWLGCLGASERMGFPSNMQNSIHSENSWFPNVSKAVHLSHVFDRACLGSDSSQWLGQAEKHCQRAAVSAEGLKLGWTLDGLVEYYWIYPLVICYISFHNFHSFQTCWAVEESHVSKDVSRCICLGHSRTLQLHLRLARQFSTTPGQSAGA